MKVSTVNFFHDMAWNVMDIPEMSMHRFRTILGLVWNDIEAMKPILIMVKVLLCLCIGALQASAQKTYCRTATIMVSSDSAGDGQPWVCALTPDKAMARISASGRSCITGENLLITGFGLQIPAGSWVRGIECVVIRKASEGGEIRDLSARLMLHGKVLSHGETVRGAVMTDSMVTFGSCTDRWGVVPDSAMLGDSSFGLAYRLALKGRDSEAYVLSAEIRVYVEEPCEQGREILIGKDEKSRVVLKYQGVSGCDAPMYCMERYDEREGCKRLAFISGLNQGVLEYADIHPPDGEHTYHLVEVDCAGTETDISQFMTFQKYPDDPRMQIADATDEAGVKTIILTGIRGGVIHMYLEDPQGRTVYHNILPVATKDLQAFCSIRSGMMRKGVYKITAFGKQQLIVSTISFY
jgi:hypothetical protein